MAWLSGAEAEGHCVTGQRTPGTEPGNWERTKNHLVFLSMTPVHPCADWRDSPDVCIIALSLPRSFFPPFLNNVLPVTMLEKLIEI